MKFYSTMMKKEILTFLLVWGVGEKGKGEILITGYTLSVKR